MYLSLLPRELEASGGVLLDEGDHVRSISVTIVRDGGFGAITRDEEKSWEPLVTRRNAKEERGKRIRRGPRRSRIRRGGRERERET
jgi:hypothetical protein